MGDVGWILLIAFFFGAIFLLAQYWYIVLLVAIGIGVALYYNNKSVKEDRMIALSYRIDDLGGVEFEKCIAELLRRNGYSNVATTKASGDFGIDIRCQKDGMKCVVQCKRYSKNVSVKAVQEASTGRIYDRADMAIVATNSHFTPAAIEMARKTGVTLWDREQIIKMLKL